MRLSKSCLDKEEKQAVMEVLDSEYLGMGQQVKLFEEELSDYIGNNRQVVCVNTGTSALHLAVTCLDIGPGDEVLLPSITYVACFQAVSGTGATPVACDVLEDFVFIDTKDAEKRITDKTKAIMAVHYASDCSNMQAIYALAEKYKLRVIEDAAHSFGTDYQGQRVGASGDIVCFSFDGIKNITSGEGGAVVTGDPVLAERLQDARLLGIHKDTERRFLGKRSWEFDVYSQGYRYHMSDLMAVIGRAQLAKIDQFRAARQSLVQSYCELLNLVPQVEYLKLDYDSINPHIFVIKVKDNLRDELRSALKEKGIESGIHYLPNHLLTYYKTDYLLPISEKIASQLLTLPLHPGLTTEDVSLVVSCIQDFFKNG